MRSLLFVSADSEKKLEEGLASGADCLILDLAAPCLPRTEALATVKALLRQIPRGEGHPLLYVGVNPLESPLVEADLATIMQGAPDGIFLPRCGNGAALQHLGARLAVLEAENDLEDGSTQVIASAAPTAASIFEMGTFRGASRRLAGLTFAPEALAENLGTARVNYAPPLALARTLTLFAAVAAGVAAIDASDTDFDDIAEFRKRCEAARREGFSAKLAILPAQVGPINQVFGKVY